VALVHCSECGREMPDQAGSCPGCSVPLLKPSTSTVITHQMRTSPIIGIVTIGLLLALVMMPYFATVFLVPAAFVCGFIAFRRGRKWLGGVSVALACIGLIGLVYVSQQISTAQEKLQSSLKDLQQSLPRAP
jgi:hypothetical protein